MPEVAQVEVILVKAAQAEVILVKAAQAEAVQRSHQEILSIWQNCRVNIQMPMERNISM